MSRKANKRRRRHRGRRRGPAVLLTLFCVVLIAGALITAMIVFFKIRNIEVIGQTRYPSEQIVEASQIEKGQNMFLFNKFAAISRIFAAAPYLDEISMKRRLPDTVEIYVTESTPAAAVQAGEGWFLMDLKGKLLEQVSDQGAEGITKITGAELNGPEVGKYAIFSESIKQNPIFIVLNSAAKNAILNDIGEVDMSQAFNIEFTYDDRFMVQIGTTDNIEKKLQFLLTVVDGLSTTEKGTIDVTDVSTARFIP